MDHGAKVKRCSSEGCTDVAQNGGVCMRHGAKRWIANDVAVQDAQILQSKECARGTGQYRNPYDLSTDSNIARISV
jgi:hypothetical protein